MVGLGQLKDSLKPLWMITFRFLKVNLYPHLYPRFGLATFHLQAMGILNRKSRRFTCPQN